MLLGYEYFQKLESKFLKVRKYLTLGGVSKDTWPEIDRGEFHLLSNKTIRLNNDGTTWVKFPDMVGNLLKGFTVNNGILTKIDTNGVFLMNGVSDLEVNKACKVYYGLAVNQEIITHEVTPHTFTNQSKVENISITALATLEVGMQIEVYALGDGVTSDVDLTAHKLDVTFWGE